LKCIGEPSEGIVNFSSGVALIVTVSSGVVQTQAPAVAVTVGVSPVSVRDAADGLHATGIVSVGVPPDRVSDAADGAHATGVAIVGVPPVRVRLAAVGAALAAAAMVGVLPVSVSAAAVGSAVMLLGVLPALWSRSSRLTRGLG
jgi:hypothetical protein